MFRWNNTLDAITLQNEHSEKVVKHANKIANTLIPQIEKGILEEHEKGYQCWYTSGFNNIIVRAKIVNQQIEVTTAITKIIEEYFKNKNFDVELDGNYSCWNALWIKW